jgi:hypothetical protein
MIFLATTLLGGILSLNNVCLFEISIKFVGFIYHDLVQEEKNSPYISLQAVIKDTSAPAFEGLKVKI